MSKEAYFLTLSTLWVGMLAASVSTALLRGTGAAVSAAALTGAQEGFQLGLKLAGSLCLWSGFAELAEKSGLSARIACFFRPLLRRFFPVSAEKAEAFGYICENLTANLLGLGNAATPLGIRAVRSMADPLHPDAATDEMCLLIVLNTASIQLIPSTVAALRAGFGAERPFSIIPAVWFSSLLSVSVGVISARCFAKCWKT